MMKRTLMLTLLTILSISCGKDDAKEKSTQPILQSTEWCTFDGRLHATDLLAVKKFKISNDTLFENIILLRNIEEKISNYVAKEGRSVIINRQNRLPFSDDLIIDLSNTPDYRTVEYYKTYINNIKKNFYISGGLNPKFDPTIQISIMKPLANGSEKEVLKAYPCRDFGSLFVGNKNEKSILDFKASIAMYSFNTHYSKELSKDMTTSTLRLKSPFKVLDIKENKVKNSSWCNYTSSSLGFQLELLRFENTHVAKETFFSDIKIRTDRDFNNGNSSVSYSEYLGARLDLYTRTFLVNKNYVETIYTDPEWGTKYTHGYHLLEDSKGKQFLLSSSAQDKLKTVSIGAYTDIFYNCSSTKIEPFLMTQFDYLDFLKTAEDAMSRYLKKVENNQ